MKLTNIRTCFASDYSVEFYIDNTVWDFTFSTEKDAERFHHLLQAIEHYQKASVLY